MSQKDYLAGLKDFWSGRPRTAIEHISKTIADNPSNESQLPLYRLWIELLASESDFAALRSLADHLSQRSENEPEFSNSYFALRGLIDFELDEVQTAELKLHALKKVNNMYVWELRYRLASRCGLSVNSYAPKKVKDAIAFDYIFARSFMMHLYQKREFDYANEIVKVIESSFPNNPFAREMRLHRNLESRDFSNALRYAHDLYELFPGHNDYPVYLAYLQIQNGQLNEAANTLVKCESMFGADDVDVSCLKAALCHQIYLHTEDEPSREQCVLAVQNAATVLELNGYSAESFSKMYHEVLESLGQDMSNSKSWMVHMSQSSFADLMLKDEDEIQTIKESLSEDAEIGDLVFMVAKDAVAQSSEDAEIRLGAVYQVVSDSVWHPIDGHQVVLELVGKPSISVKIPVILDDRRKTSRTNKTIFEMDDNASEQVYSTIEEYANDEASIGQLRSELDRIRSAS